MTRVVVVNAGSSTLKLRVLGADDEITWDQFVDPWDGSGGAVHDALVDAGAVDAVGHRVVHGGDLAVATLVDDDLVARLTALTELAPLHQPRALAALHAARECLPDLPHVACFDTAFHTTMPAAARTYALPRAWRAQWGLRRYGFHGLSHAWVARCCPTGRVVSCHLGAGASLCAIRDGRSVDTTMGFTPLEGLVMATRSGSVDPGLVLWLLQTGKLDADVVAHGLERESGLAGLSGTDGDMRSVLAARDRGDADAVLAFDVYVHRLRREIAAMGAALGGIDVLAFTGGIGEHLAEVRDAAVDGLRFLGAAFTIVVVEAREDLEMARQVRGVLATRAS